MSANVAANTPVALECNDDTFTVPASVTVPAGQATATFTVDFGGGATIATAHVVAHAGGYSQRARVNAVGNVATLAISGLAARSGRGGVWLSWSGVPEDVFGNWIRGYRVLRKLAGGSFAQLAVGIDAGSFVDTTAAEGAQYVYKVELRNGAGALLASSAEVAHTKTLGGPTMAWPTVSLNSGSVIVAFANPDLQQEHYTLLVDGKPFGTGSASASTGGSPGTIVCEIDTTVLANGPHSAVLVSDGEQDHLHASNVKTFKTLNLMHSVSNDGICVTGDGEYSEFRATYALGGPCTVQVLGPNNAVVRSWTFDGGEAKVVWDGKDALGAYAADGEYKVKSEGGNPVNGTFYRLVKSGNAPEFLAIVNYAKDRDQENGYDPDLLAETIAYGNRVRSYVQQLSQNKSSLPWLFYMVYDMETISRETVRKLRKWLRSSVSSLYLHGHGSRPAEQVQSHSVAIGSNVKLYNSGAARTGWTAVTIPSLIGPRQYRFLFLDTCHSVGSNSNNNPQDCWPTTPPNGQTHGTYMTRFPHKQWATAFNVDTDEILEGAFVGFNGQGFFCNDAGIGKAWRDWRDYFWQALSSGNYSVAAALSRADQLLPSFAAQPNPESFCAGAINKSKRYQAGDWQW